jgi:hypothetical protein
LTELFTSLQRYNLADVIEASMLDGAYEPAHECPRWSARYACTLPDLCAFAHAATRLVEPERTSPPANVEKRCAGRQNDSIVKDRFDEFLRLPETAVQDTVKRQSTNRKGSKLSVAR